MTRAERNVILAQNAATIKAQKAKIERAEAAACRMETAIRWALGEGDDFPAREDGQGAYWWRNELRGRAALASPQPCEHQAAACRMREALEYAQKVAGDSAMVIDKTESHEWIPTRKLALIIALNHVTSKAEAALASTGTCPYEKELAEAKALLAECEGWLKEDSPGELIDKIEAFEKGGGE